jgi:2-amino-4-hydroxy-6-hydroxymethyldihydropteridine diphosphokinase
MSSEWPIIAYIGLGSNMGDREHHLLEAVSRLDAHPHIEVVVRSSFYETEPVGFIDQDAFLNMVVAVRTTLNPDELLTVMLTIEIQLGRVRDVRWGPRTIDLDMLVYGQVERNDERLELPHPRMLERAFVLVPLIEAAAPHDPSYAEWLRSRLERLDRKEGVMLWKKVQ